MSWWKSRWNSEEFPKKLLKEFPIDYAFFSIFLVFLMKLLHESPPVNSLEVFPIEHLEEFRKELLEELLIEILEKILDNSFAGIPI